MISIQHTVDSTLDSTYQHCDISFQLFKVLSLYPNFSWLKPSSEFFYNRTAISVKITRQFLCNKIFVTKHSNNKAFVIEASVYSTSLCVQLVCWLKSFIYIISLSFGHSSSKSTKLFHFIGLVLSYKFLFPKFLLLRCINC